jgi:hypothetical protein
MATYREPLFDDVPIEPRPEPEPVSDPQPLPTEPDQPLQKNILAPNPASAIHRATEPRAIAAKGIREYDGASEADLLLVAIANVARREPLNKAALRTLCVRFTREYSF